MTPGEAYASTLAGLRTALQAHERLRVLDSPSDRPDRGSVVVGPPSFVWEGQCDPDHPTSMAVTVYLIARLDERAVEYLLDELPDLLVALAGVHDATVSAAEPGTYPTSGSDLPCYRITAEMTL